MSRYFRKHIFKYPVLLALLMLSLSRIDTVVAADVDVSNDGSNAEALADDKILAQMMDDARQAMYEHDYNVAIKVYTNLSEMPDHIYRRDALESLGLAYERSGEFSEAIQVYQRYVQIYQKGDDYDRVRQRLAGLLTATWEEPKVVEKKSEPRNWRSYGSLFQFVRRSGSSSNQSGTVIGQYAVVSSLDLNARGREGGFDIRTRITGGNLYDLKDDPKKHQQQLSYLYIDLAQRGKKMHGRVGRQRSNGGGVLGRFDGVDLGVRINSEYAVNVVVGFPVGRTSDVSLNTSRRFRGINVEGGPWHDYWLANSYYIEQMSEGYLDRRAVGAEIRYLHPKRSLYTLIDYDAYFNTLNVLSNQMSWRAEDETSYNLLVDYRNAPPVTTRNALFGQAATTLQTLHETYSESEIRQLARDRIAHYFMVAAGVAHPIGENYRWEADVTASKFGDTPASGGVPASAGTPMEYYYSTRFNASNYFKQGDVNILGLYLADGATYRMITFSVNSRLPVGSKLYFNPRLQLGFRRQNATGGEDRVTGAGLRVEYVLEKAMLLEFDSSTDWTETDTLLGLQKFEGFYITAGYRWMF